MVKLCGMNGIIYRKRVRAMTIRCLRGACWLTWKGSVDITLGPGESVEVRGVRDFCLEVMRGGEAHIVEGGVERKPAVRASGAVRAA